ncbi:hypothetical protein EXIGLDRAFT_696699 [Exidia glandulosa HHB12029]|uniref:Uncharacterized protein n=1 Tax=Exidia glandulosa HHB12029 TaxID=1314781 RepID=A0A165N1R1_EXIGL|nr:hypothetical protein EXIGLDRAFT_696699 [Exidia glandulosa HHB12029]
MPTSTSTASLSFMKLRGPSEYASGFVGHVLCPSALRDKNFWFYVHPPSRHMLSHMYALISEIASHKWRTAQLPQGTTRISLLLLLSTSHPASKPFSAISSTCFPVPENQGASKACDGDKEKEKMALLPSDALMLECAVEFLLSLVLSRQPALPY